MAQPAAVRPLQTEEVDAELLNLAINHDNDVLAEDRIRDAITLLKGKTKPGSDEYVQAATVMKFAKVMIGHPVDESPTRVLRERCAAYVQSLEESDFETLTRRLGLRSDLPRDEVSNHYLSELQELARRLRKE